jgi:predicted chitinase
MAHFLGQGAHESAFLAKMVEGANGFYYESLRPEIDGWYNNPDNHYYTDSPQNYNNKNGNKSAEDAIKFRGRGMKQLTGRCNYVGYWTYRGWRKQGRDYEGRWKDGPKVINVDVNDPQLIGLMNFETIDAGAWYWTAAASSNSYMSINNKISEGNVSDSVIETVTKAINGATWGIDDRQKQTKRIYSIIKE